MIPKPLTDIAESDLLNLVTNQAIEGKTIEYKVAFPGNADQDKVRFLRAVSSLANTAGGDLLFGVQASDGLPTAVPGIADVNEDAERLRLEGLCRDGLQERVRNLQFRFVKLGSGAVVLVIRVPKSWGAPHRVTLGGHGHFYARNSGGAYQLDVPELRSAFLLSPTVATRIREFREDRLANIGAKNTPVPIQDGGIMVFHVAPFQSFAEPVISRLELTREQSWNFAPPNVQGLSTLHNFDGYLVYYGGDQPVSTYVQVFRSGVVEYVNVFNYERREGVLGLPGPWIESDLHNVAPRFCANLEKLGVEPPYYLMLSLLQIGQHTFDTGSTHDYGFATAGRRAGRDNLLLPEVALESATFDVPVTLRPIANLLWNSFGYERSFSYDEKGNFTRKKW